LDSNILQLKGISKSFGSNLVLDNVDFSVQPGEIHALVGENGAGKSTLMNITYGIVAPNAGEIVIDGQAALINNANDAQKYGICYVHQEIALCPDLTVAQNIFMSEINVSKKMLVNYRDLNRRAAELLAPLNSEIRPDDLILNLSISSQQVVEIAKGMSTNCKVLILDEPTASLSESETEALYEIIRKLKEQGIGIIYISHRMGEIFELCDRVTVLRDGVIINTYNVIDVTARQIVKDMAGRDIESIYPEKAAEVERSDSNILLEVEGLADEQGQCRNISFKLYKGEILGFAGLVGSGRTETMLNVCQLLKPKAGKVVYQGGDIVGKKASNVFRDGLVYLPEDRKAYGLFLEMHIKHNIPSMHLSEVTDGILISSGKEENMARQISEWVNVRCSSLLQQTVSLSGGNQQKVLVGKTLAKMPRIMIMDEPTRGIDVGAKSEIHKLLRGLANDGIGVILISSELNEILGMADRVMVMREGEICAEISKDDIDSTNIMHYASGAHLLAHA